MVCKVQLNVNVETTIVSKIDDNKDRCVTEVGSTDTQAITAFEPYHTVDHGEDGEDKYPTFV